MSKRDYIPQAWDAYAVWMANFNTHLPSVAAKYGVATTAVEQIGRDNEWVQFWVNAKNSARQQEKQLNDYVDAVANGDLNDPALENPAWNLPPDVPHTVPPGIKKRVREIANSIKAQKSIYNTADGELLGIVTPEEAGLTEADFTAELKLRSLANFAVEVDFRRFGADAVRIEYRHKGGTWILAAFLTSSPGVFNIVPSSAGEAEQIEVRAICMIKNHPFGNYSPIYTVIIQP